MTDDTRAIKYIKNHMTTLPQSIQLTDVLFEAYMENYLGDFDLKEIQKTLEDKDFKIKYDLATEATRRRLMLQTGNDEGE